MQSQILLNLRFDEGHRWACPQAFCLAGQRKYENARNAASRGKMDIGKASMIMTIFAHYPD